VPTGRLKISSLAPGTMMVWGFIKQWLTSVSSLDNLVTLCTMLRSITWESKMCDKTANYNDTAEMRRETHNFEKAIDNDVVRRVEQERAAKQACTEYGGERVATAQTVGQFLEGRIKRLYRQLEAMERLKGSMSQDMLRSPYSTISALMEP
jgi:hypothetical protein